MNPVLNRRAFLGLVVQARRSDAFARGRAFPHGLADAVTDQTAPDTEFTLLGTVGGGDETWTLARWGFPLADGRPGGCAFLVKHAALTDLLPPPALTPTVPAPTPETAPEAPLLAAWTPTPALPGATVQGSLW